MYQNFNSSNSQLDKVMTNEQFNQIVDAIISGKYSWACLLILRFAGYNPLHYIPYRTYNRLMKSNRTERSTARESTAIAERTGQKSATKLRDLCYSEELTQSETVKGGFGGFSDNIINFLWSSDIKSDNSR